jgi:hypothetical protein
VNRVADCTIAEKVLLAAYTLEEAGMSTFSAEALVVSAWKKYPCTFGLKSFADLYPDSNKVMASVLGERGLARRGWLSRVETRLYTLTRDGRQTVRKLLQGDTPAPAVALSPEQEHLLQRLLTCTALARFREGREAELTFVDACRFWGVTDSLHGEQLDWHLAQFEASVADLDRRLGLGHCVLAEGRSVSGDDLARLGELHAHLGQRFGRHLALLRNRTTAPAVAPTAGCR